VFRRQRYLTGATAADLRWFTPAGAEMTAENWSDPTARSVAVFIDGTVDPDVAADGTPLVDDDFLVLFNAWWEPLTFTLAPDVSSGRWWDIACDSFDPARGGGVDGSLQVGPRSVVVLRSPAAR
jgi:glycogen operon protein